MDSKNVNDLVALANYFRGAMLDEIKLPDNAATMPQSVNLNGLQLIQTSPQATHYKEIVLNIEKTLETFANTLIASASQASAQTKLNFEKNLASVKETTKNKKKALVTAETSISNKKVTVKPKNKEKTVTTAGLLPDNKTVIAKTEKKENLSTKKTKQAVAKYTISKEGKIGGTLEGPNNMKIVLTNYKTLKEFEESCLVTCQKAFNLNIKDSNEIEYINKSKKNDPLVITPKIEVKKYDTSKDFKKSNLTTDRKDEKEDSSTATLESLIFRGDSDEGLPIYNALTTIPKINSEDATVLIGTWNKENTIEGRAKVYNKICKLLNNYKLSVGELKQTMLAFIKIQEKENKKENEGRFEDQIKKANISPSTTTDFSKLRTGEFLTTGKVKWLDKEGNFDILLLTESFTHKEVDPENFVKLFAMHERLIGQEKEAIDTIIKFYSNTEKKDIWSIDKATWFLNQLFRVNKLKELEYIIENMLLAKQKKGNYKDAIPFAKSFLINYSKCSTTSIKLIKGKKEKFSEESYWSNVKIDAIIDRAIEGKRMKAAIKAVVTSIKTKTGADGTVRSKSDKKTVSSNKVEIQADVGNKTIDPKKSKITTARIAKKVNTPAKQKKAVKMLEKDNVLPKYEAIIRKEKDGTFTCLIKGFENTVKTIGSKTIDEAKKDFATALYNYNVKIMEDNDKAKASHTKGKMLHLKPDFTKGSLTFLVPEVKNTGT